MLGFLLTELEFTRMWRFDMIEITQFLLVLNSLDHNYEPLFSDYEHELGPD